MKLNSHTARLLLVAVLTAMIVPVYSATEHTRALSEGVTMDAPIVVQKDAEQYKKIVLKWQIVFLTRDVQTAYAQFLREGNTISGEEAHVIAHIVGGFLYDLRGLDGLALCTGDFNYGCYHGFAARVVAVNGVAGLKDLTDACKQLSTLDCEHGIGHGLVVFFGDGELNHALSACSAFEHRTGGCEDGVFMELFLNSMRRGEDRGGFVFSEADPDMPCATVTDPQNHTVCHYWLPVMWRSRVRTEPAPIQFAYVGRLCERIDDTSLRASCFSGAGMQVALAAEYDEAVVHALCAVMPADGNGPCEREALDFIQRRMNLRYDI